MRWCPTCVGERRRTEALWRVPRRRGRCCGWSWSADLPLGSSSTDQCTEEDTEEETEECVSARRSFFLGDGCCCCVWLFCLSTCLTLSWTFLADGLFLHSFFLLLLFSTLMLPTFTPALSLFLSSLIRLCIHKHSSFVVYRALVSINGASLLLQKDSLKCQLDWAGVGHCFFYYPIYLGEGATIIKITGLI